MSIQLRLNLAIALLMALGLFFMIGFILIDAKPRTEAENESTIFLTETLIKSSLQALKESADPQEALNRLVGELRNLRHASVRLASSPIDAGKGAEEVEEGSWIPWEKSEPLTALSIPVEVGGKVIDTIEILPRPGDELEELWEAIARIFQLGVIILAVTLLLTWVIINRSLKPVHALRNAMGRLEAGDFDFRVKEEGPPELKSICGSLNGLAAALQTAQKENRSLTAHMILIQDQERRDIARELHDELGPYLFSMRTDGALLGRELEKPEPDLTKSQRLTSQIIGHVDQLRQTNRRVLERLTPPGLSELGLSGAIQAMVAMWRRGKSDVEIDLNLEGTLDLLDESTRLTVYRIIQEGLTNAFRHSGAEHISVGVFLREKPPLGTGGSDQNNVGVVEVSVRDNGHGRPEPSQDGFGLRAMRERVSALSGSFSFASVEGKGTDLSVTLPASLAVS
ncbi:hypothetical protein DLM45_03710 [Hyphomicrobium methylovorum]|uniref:ATP-binding protein n=1 Tax=Hyphomicrobium methylovorum TaxID=84 RepID=UPI0015E6DC44|nr:histidine kinase [Hyphomicrobium methylovorum]MBA2125330.1 hypothetical protein [Hyphomicrobium methylovorum]